MSENSIQVEKTTDYDIFKKDESNRNHDEALLKKLEAAIKQTNLLKTHPILVNKERYVIDGQHRLEVARRLQIPIYYMQDDSFEKKDMITCNVNLKPWTIVDYLNFYVNQGYEHYEWLNIFIQEEKLQLNIALHLLNGCRSADFFKKFKEGKYTFPTQAEYEEVKNKKKLIKEVIDYIKKSTSGHKTYLDRVTFYGALVDFFNIKSFVYETFMKKLSYKLDLIHPCTKQCEYVRIFKEIYNWKNHQPLKDSDM